MTVLSTVHLINLVKEFCLVNPPLWDNLQVFIHWLETLYLNKETIYLGLFCHKMNMDKLDSPTEPFLFQPPHNSENQKGDRQQAHPSDFDCCDSSIYSQLQHVFYGSSPVWLHSGGRTSGETKTFQKSNYGSRGGIWRVCILPSQASYKIWSSRFFTRE